MLLGEPTAEMARQLMEQARPVIGFVRDNGHLAAPLVFLLAFGESLAIIGLFLPFFAMLVAIGALITVSGLDFWTIWLAASIGAALGDWVSYWLGWRFGSAVTGWWPLRRYPGLLDGGERFFARYGWAAIAFGRFSGPLRATVPLVAGMARMPALPFQLANWASAFVWAAALLLPGAALARYLPS